MRSSHTLSPAAIFGEALGIGLSIGLLHGVAESTLLGLNGIRPSALDLAILVGFPAVISTSGAALIAVAALTPPLRSMLARTDGLPAFRRLAWSALAGGYFLVFVKMIYYWSGWGTALKWSLPAFLTLALAGFAVLRKGRRALLPLCGTLLIAVSLCALHLSYAEWEGEPEGPGSFTLRLLLAVGVCFLALVALVWTTSSNRPFQPVKYGATPLAVTMIGWAGFWFSLDSNLSVGSFLAAEPRAASETRPNFLLIVLDTVRADHLDLFGYERVTMPNLAKFAQECHYVNRTITPGPWTLPSHASMFTGLYPSAHGAHYPFVTDEDAKSTAYSLAPDMPTLAGFLSGMGYQTAGVVANFGVMSQYGLPRGFQHYEATPGSAYFAEKILWVDRFRIGHGPSLGEFLRTSLPDSLQGRSRIFSVREPTYRRAWEINSRVTQWLERHGHQPFFLYVNYFDAHAPYLPIREDDERFVKRPGGEGWFGFPLDRFNASSSGAASFTPGEIEFLEGQYDAELVSLDRELGRLFDYLSESGYFENTVIIVTTDHGEAFFEHGFPGHSTSIYQPEIDGCLLVRTPPSLGSIQVSPLMQAVDFLPTIAEILGVPAPGGIDGSPWGKGRDYMLTELFCRSCGAELGGGEWPDELRRHLVGVVIDGQKLIRSTRAPDEVYNVSVDPSETSPISDPAPAFMQRAEQIIAERNRRLIKGLSDQTEDKMLLERLRSLGYVQ